MPKKTQIAIIMGSDSDLPTMSQAAQLLDEFGISYELKIVSAHRTPERMASFAKEAAAKGIKVIIAGAGGAAHLPGMTAAYTQLPVIGVPVKTSTLAGVDSLYSIVQMPKGIPVACVAIDNAVNAALLAISILALQDKKLSTRLKNYRHSQTNQVMKKTTKLEKNGYQQYLKSNVE
jgi:5-(carboxyamino)imidazole ribonucleotide mutase